MTASLSTQLKKICGFFFPLLFVAASSLAETPQVVLVQGEPEYGSAETMQWLAEQIEEKLKADTVLLQSKKQKFGELPDLSLLENADLLILFTRFRTATAAQFQILSDWFEQGKPAIAFRTTSHGFWEDKGWFVPYFGGHYKSHASNREGTTVVASVDQMGHPILRGVDFRFHVTEGGTYNAQPLSNHTTPLLFGKTGDIPSEPVAWTAEYKPGQRLFYTSLGAKENFDHPSFQNLCLNAVRWALNLTLPLEGIPAHSDRPSDDQSEMEGEGSFPPERKHPADAHVFFDGNGLNEWRHWDPSTHPRAIDIDERADTTVGGPVYESARWISSKTAIQARPGFGDIVTKESFQDGLYHLDFLIPELPPHMSGSFDGNSGVFISGRWEIQIINSFGNEEIDDRNTCGALFGLAAPMVNACRPPGEWQELEVAVRDIDGRKKEISAWLNGRQIHDRVTVSGNTLYGFQTESPKEEVAWEDFGVSKALIFNESVSDKLNLGKDFTIEVHFRTDDDGVLFSKLAPNATHGEHDKCLYIADGEPVFDIGYVGALVGDIDVADGEWHSLVVQQKNSKLQLKVDGDVVDENDEFRYPDPKGARFMIGAGALDFPSEEIEGRTGFYGDFKRVRAFNAAFDLNQIDHQKPLIDWNGNRSGALVELTDTQSKLLDLNKPFTAAIRFKGGNGVLFAKAPSSGPWAPNGKVLFKRGRDLTYDIGWVGALRSRSPKITNDQWHTTVITRDQKGKTQLYLDGNLLKEIDDFGADDIAEHRIKIGAGADNFPFASGGPFDGEISHFAFINKPVEANAIQGIDLTKRLPSSWIYVADSSVLSRERRAFQIVQMESPAIDEKNQDSKESPATEVETSIIAGPLRLQADSSPVRFANLWRTPLSDVDHAALISSWDGEALARGKRIYDAICITCHGNLQQEGTLPTSRKFWEAEFKNGKDPYSLVQTLGNGFGQMPPFPFLNYQQRYDVIHYIRETLVKPTNAKEYYEITPDYLTRLPKGFGKEGILTDEMKDFAAGPKYLRMDFGPMLNWTYQVAPGNIAYKAIAVRLDRGPGGVSRGRAWQVFDHDTMRLAAAWSGSEFIDWKGIAFDQSHGTHASIVGDIAFTNPVGPGWAHPKTGAWEDPRFLGRDNKPYGPLPRDWAQFKGQFINGDDVILHYTVGETEILEQQGMDQSDQQPIFTRTLNVGPSFDTLKLRIAPNTVSAAVIGSDLATLKEESGYQIAEIGPHKETLTIKILVAGVEAQTLAIAALVTEPASDLSSLTKGGQRRWTEETKTQGLMGENVGPFAVDEIAYPETNPYGSWMRLGGFDFLPDGKRAAVATWLGDVWIVDGLQDKLGSHTWKRIASGLFQPLGLKYADGHIYVTCRDQLAKLHDLNGDEEIDHIECFNNDHQVTEHFHEFAMGLQTDQDGNFYYAKSARHALPALVPHHGTLLKVSKDGQTTEILAKGFRAANGVCLNPDGSFIVTDQEGHWNPKNRINYVTQGGFYGNMMGYHEITDTSDDAMEQPLCWITNAFDRSPGELIWAPEGGAWGPFNGRLLNLSYGTGQIFVVPHEIIEGQAQGGMVSLGLDFPTGLMRGRFHRGDGHLYATGMFAWAGNKRRDGGFYRIRYTGQPAQLPIHLEATKRGLRLSFSEPVDPTFASAIENYQVKVWGLKRTKSYGSRHYNERPLTVSDAVVAEDRQSVFLVMPEIEPTWCMEVKMSMKAEDGTIFDRTLHNTIHKLKADLSF